MKILSYVLMIYVLFSWQAGGAAEPEVEQRVKQGLLNIIPDVEIDTISATSIPGLYQVTMGADVLYVTGDGRFALTGEMYDIEGRENITNAEKSRVRKAMLARVPESELIEFAPEKPEHTIYVFTDITCGYCRRLHQDVPVLNENGIAVRYLAYPRAGPASSSAQQLQAVWCAKDQNRAMTDAKSGKPTSSESCEDPVARHFKLGNEIGVRGTPAIYLEDGRSLPGYVPPAEILGLLNGGR